MRKSTTNTPRGRAPRKTGRADQAAEVEWVGGRFRLPTYVEGEGEPFRPELALWLELPSELIVGHAIARPDGQSTLADTLRDALDRLEQGAAGEPRRLRVAEHAAAIELRSAFRDRFPIEVAPTPELEVFLESFLQSRSADGQHDASYLEGGRVEEATVARMFRAAAMLYRTAPWKVASDSDVLRMDIPALGVEGACVTIIGALGESFGLIVFPSLLGYERFLEAAEAGPGGGPLDLGGPLLSLNLEAARDLPRSMRREIASHGWPTVAPDAMPFVTHRDRDGVPRPISERDVQIVTECAFAVSSFFVRHRASFEREETEPVSESSTMSDTKVTVRLTMPYGSAELFDGEESRHAASPFPAKPGAPAMASTAKAGRNDPCPCGSGKKYKKCCLDSVQGAASEERRRVAAHELDERMVWTLRDFAQDIYGERWRAAVAKVERAAGKDTPMRAQLTAPWSAYEVCVDGERVLDAFVAECHGRLSGEERDWLAAQRVARLDVWEVVASEPGVAVSVRGLLSGELRRVSEARGSRALVVRDAILARITDYRGGSYFCGMYPRMLPPHAAEKIVQAAKRRAGAKGSARRDEDAGLTLVRAWTKAVQEEERDAARPRQLVNTDGEPFVLTTDHFDLDTEAQSEVEAILRGLDGVEPPADGEDDYTITKPGNAMHRSWDNTIVGRVVVTDGRLRLETNSIPRADDLRARLEQACGGRLRHRAREHVDPQSSARAAGRARPAPSPGPEVQAALREMKARHYAQWLDDPVPALSGKTPRQAARSKAGRERVDLLLRTMENYEQRSGDDPFDFGDVRRELGLDGVR